MEATEQDASDATIGIRLQLLREQKGLTLQEVSAETHISFSNLVAIEAENFDQLPADTFVRGLVNIYGNYLGLEGTETARLFLEERDRQQPRGRKNRFGKQGHALAPKKLAEPSHISSATVAGILLLFIVVSVTTFCLYTGWNPFAYFIEQGQQATPPLTGTVLPGSGDTGDPAPTALSETTAPPGVTTARQNAAATSSTVQQQAKSSLKTAAHLPDN